MYAANRHTVSRSILPIFFPTICINFCAVYRRVMSLSVFLWIINAKVLTFGGFILI